MKNILIFVFGILLIETVIAVILEYDDNNDDDYSDEYDIDNGVRTSSNELRQVIFNPRKRRQRRRRNQAAASELKGLEFCFNAHNKCEHINKNETKFTLTNDKPLSVWHCNCDMEFYQCLHRINSIISNNIGELYFTLHTRCYRNDYRIFECNEYDTRSNDDSERRCIRYLLLLHTPIQSQWFDLPFYSGKQMKKPMFTFEDV